MIDLENDRGIRVEAVIPLTIDKIPKDQEDTERERLRALIATRALHSRPSVSSDDRELGAEMENEIISRLASIEKRLEEVWEFLRGSGAGKTKEHWLVLEGNQIVIKLDDDENKAAYSPGDLVLISIFLPTETERVDLLARVENVSVQQSGRRSISMGIETIGEDYHERLSRFAFQLQRLGRRLRE